MEELNSYPEAIAKFEAAKARAERVISKIHGIADVLREWDNVTVSNVSLAGFKGFPIDMERKYSIAANAWPTANEVAQALADYHVARLNVHQAWHRIPSDQRAAFKAPPGE